MSILVSSGQSRLQCDHSGCNCKSRYIVGDNDGQSNVRRVCQDNLGWQCLTNSKDYCPTHAYKLGKDRTNEPLERAKKTLGIESVHPDPLVEALELLVARCSQKPYNDCRPFDFGVFPDCQILEHAKRVLRERK